ncbi:hypothetical protein [Mycobacterium sp. OAE908]|uniref:dCTP deaminase domain-containing protein n=1 Tax=Mycobacterium sp. OAE908 TaxID=2817899 RepID=UPI001AE89675
MNEGNGFAAAGLLNDEELFEALNAGRIFRRGTWDPSGVQQCSYLLRMGPYVDYPQNDSNGGVAEKGHRVYTRHRLDPDAQVKLTPGDTVLVSILERFEVDPGYMAFTIPRGLLYAESLLVASSYVDPGFGDDFFVPITNVSDRTVLLPAGLPLARIFVFRLARAVKAPYKTGATSSLREELEHVTATETPSAEVLRTLSNDNLLNKVRGGVPSGDAVAEALARAMAPRADQEPAAASRDYGSLSKAELLRALKQDVPGGVGVSELIRRQERRNTRQTIITSAVLATLISSIVVLASTDLNFLHWLRSTLWTIALGAAGSALVVWAVSLVDNYRRRR